MDAVLTCLVDEKVGPGEALKKLSAAACDFFSASAAIALRSPDLALNYALSALDVPPGSAVALSALAPSWHYGAVRRWGFRPVVLDVDGETAQIPLDALDAAVRDGVRVILLYEPLGLLPDLEAVAALGVPVVEDVSQAAGSSFRGRKAGSFGVFGILGLEERDALTAGGGALLLASKHRDGMVIKRLAEEAESVDLLPDINSALALIQIREFQKNEARRREIAEVFSAALMQGRHKTFPVPEGAETGAFCFPALLASGFKDVKQYAARFYAALRSKMNWSGGPVA
jgi:dTDP-4-amino-4,6-dideoxygalactose transaminase